MKILEKKGGNTKIYSEEKQNRERILKLYKILELKSIFIADISHELRTSLTIMHCTIDLMFKDLDFKKKNLQSFKNITAEIKRITSILTDLTLLTKTNSTTIKSHHQKIDLNQIVSAICKELQILADKKKVKILYKKKHQPIELFASKEDVEKILLNLIKNSITCNVIGGWIKVDLRKTKKGVYLYVKDGGVGMSKKELPHIFERFYSTKISHKNKESGLGLAICKHIIEGYEGKITVKSKLQRGSTFSVFFPYKNS